MTITPAIEKQFGKWLHYWKPFIQSEKFDNIFRTLTARKGVAKTAPLSEDLFRVFRDTDPGNLKVVICGLCPYHTFVDGKPVADGLALSTRNGKIQPSLWKVYEMWERVYGECKEMWKDGDLSYLAQQGVLLYNVALTTEESKAGSDVAIWQEANRYFWEEIIAKYFRGLCVVLLGDVAHRSAQYIDPKLHYLWKLQHPAFSARNETTWPADQAWKEIDKVLMENNKWRVMWQNDLPF